MTVTTSILSVKGLRAGYRGVPVIYDVDLDVAPGEIVVVLGSNGAGKTTTLKSIVGIVSPLAGQISYQGSEWALGKPWRAAGAGIGVVNAPGESHGSAAPHSALQSLTFSVGDVSVTRNSLTSKPIPPAPITATLLPIGLAPVMAWA